MVVVREQGWSQYVMRVTFQLWLLNLAICGRLLLICIKIITITFKYYYNYYKKIPQIPFRSILEAIPFQ